MQTPTPVRLTANVAPLCDSDVETLVLMGNLDFSAPVEYAEDELMPHLKRGQLIVLSIRPRGFVRLQPEAFNHMAGRFF